MSQAEARKPAEAGMREDIEKQQLKMRELFNELRETVKKPDWNEKPKEFFKSIGGKMKKAGIDEAEFTEFVIKEVGTSYSLTFRRAYSVWMEALDTSEFPIKVNEKRRLGVYGRFGLAEMEADVAKPLVAIAESIRDAGRKKLNVGEFFEKMNEEEAGKTFKSNLELAEAYIQYWKDEERDRFYSGGKPEQAGGN